MNLKGYIGIFLLALFSVTMIPKELYHDCGHDVNLSQELNTDEMSNGDCPICNYAFSSPFQVNEAPLTLSLVHHSDFFSIPTPVIQVSPTDSPPLRGPPFC